MPMLASDISGLPGIAGGSAGFSGELDDAVAFIHLHHAEFAGFAARHRQAGHGALGPFSTWSISMRE